MSYVKMLVPQTDFTHTPQQADLVRWVPELPYSTSVPGSLSFFPVLSHSSHGWHTSSLLPSTVLTFVSHSGGAQYDQNHIILNTVNTEKLTQVWEAMVL